MSFVINLKHVDLILLTRANVTCVFRKNNEIEVVEATIDVITSLTARTRRAYYTIRAKTLPIWKQNADHAYSHILKN